jgi:RNA polymerase sigma factor (sigma-70 family)
MATNLRTGTVEALVQVIRAATGTDPPDADLLHRFTASQDEGAFTALVRRHGPMVLGVCRRLLPNEQDAEDAFQATFLILALKAASVRPAEMLGSWLHGVARTTALKARRTRLRRTQRERLVAVLPEPEPVPREADPLSDLLPILDDELARLPNRFRAVVVLCDLEGLTRPEAARQLGVPEGTVNSRLSRARALLAQRLSRHSATLSGGALALLLTQCAAARVPAAVTLSAIRLAALMAGTGTAAPGVLSAGVAHLVEGVTGTMFVTKLKSALAALLVLAGIGLGGVLSLRADADERQPPPAATAPQGKAAPAPENNLKNTLLALDQHLWEASAKGDWQERSKFYAEDMVSVSVLGKYGKADCVAADKRVRCTDWTISDAEVVPTSKDTAVLCYRYSCKVTTDGKSTETRKDYRVTYVWANRNGGWVLVFCFDDHGRKANPADDPFSPYRLKTNRFSTKDSYLMPSTGESRDTPATNSSGR